ncbi:MAG: ABC transporter permease, partial [Bacteroidota bacterium]|nr:ABC transporter permease [Bacteroidota bacterium]
MKLLKLIAKNLFRHKLRTALTMLGIAVAILAFGLLRTVVTAWYAGVDASASNRLISRDAVSFIFPLPYSYRDQIAKIPGVSEVSFATWFQGTYIDNRPEHFFPRMAVDAETIFDLYPEFLVPHDQLEAFKRERNSCVIGEKAAKEFNLKIGDIITIQGDIYPGAWQFVIRGIYKPKDKTVDATQMFFHWTYLDEQLKQDSPFRAGKVGWYIIRIDKAGDAPQVSEAIDRMFENSPAKTKTETEKAFQQSFVSLSSAIVTSLEVVSYIIIGIILLVLANTIIMSARERIREYAVLKTLGFTAKHIVLLVGGESLFISLIGGAAGVAGTFPAVAGFGAAFPTFFPVFNIAPITL